MSTTAEDGPEAGVIFTFEGDLVTAQDIESGVADSGASKAEALSLLADALLLHEGGGEPIEDEDAFFRELGVDPDTVEKGDSPPPWLE